MILGGVGEGKGPPWGPTRKIAGNVVLVVVSGFKRLAAQARWGVFFFVFWRGGFVGKEESIWVFGLCVYWNELMGTEMVDSKEESNRNELVDMEMLDIEGLWVVSIVGDMAYQRR